MRVVDPLFICMLVPVNRSLLRVHGRAVVPFSARHPVLPLRYKLCDGAKLYSEGDSITSEQQAEGLDANARPSEKLLR